MSLSTADLHDLPSTFYRVAVKALIRDQAGRLLIGLNEEGKAELPGGGWEHDESLEDCIRREIKEEIGVEVDSIGTVSQVARGFSNRGWRTIRILVDVKVSSESFVPGDSIVSVKYVTKSEFLALTFANADSGVADLVNEIWKEAKG